MHPIDTVLQELQHRDHQRSRLLRAMESQAATTSPAKLSVANYFQTEMEQTQRAHKFRSHHTKKARKVPDPAGFFNHQGALMTDTSDREHVFATKQRPKEIRKILKKTTKVIFSSLKSEKFCLACAK